MSLLLVTLLPALGAGCKGGGGGGGSSAVPPPGTGRPVAVLSASPTQGTAPLGVSFDGSSSTHDPDQGPLSYLWDLGNGASSTAVSGVVTYSSPGTYILRLTVTDAAGQSAEDAQAVEVLAQGGEPFAHRVLHLTNLERQGAGLPPLKGEASLEAAAQGHALDMAQNDYFSHQSLDGRTFWQRIQDAGYDFNSAGENIAAGQATPEEVVADWMASPGHRDNILHSAFRELGVAYQHEPGDVFPGPSGYRHYWVQDFGTRLAVFPVVIDLEAHETTSTAVELYIYGAGWAILMMVSEDPTFAGASWEPYRTSYPWVLSPGPGLKRVHVRLRSASLAEREAFDEIILR